MKEVQGHLGMCSSRASKVRAFTRLLASAGAAALASSLLATPALAQDSAADEANSNDIIVTAQRRNERLEDVPMSVSVVTAETLSNAGVASLRDLSNVTTGFTLNQAGGFPQPTIRGITTTINGTNLENNVAIYVDGLYQVSGQAINIDLPNVESIQVLKGPQGTLYGRNATGGALLLSTITPGKDWHGKAEFTYARFDDKRGSAYVAGPVSDRIGISLAGYYRRSDGYTKLTSRTVPGETKCCGAPVEQDSFRAKLKADLSDNFTATLGYAYTHTSDPRGNLFAPLENVRAVLAPAYATAPRELGVAAYDIGTQIETKQHDGSLTLELDSGIGKLKSITGYSQVSSITSFDFDGTYLNGQWSSSTGRSRTFQQALDLSVDTIENFDLVVGANYFQDRFKFTDPSRFYSGANNNSGATEQPLSTYTLLTTSFFEQKKDAWAIYGDATYHIGQLSINVGGRYSKEKQSVLGNVDPNPILAGTPTFAAVFRAPNNKSTTFSQFTPRASVRYELAPRTNLYFTYSKGFRSGAYNASMPANPNDWVPAKQETVDSFELGLKGAGRNFRFEASGFYYDYKNLQVAATIIGASGAPVITVTNAPKAKIYGAEASFDWEPVENLTLRAGATWLHARYGDGFYFSSVGVANAGAGGAVGINTNADLLKTYFNVNQIQNLSGLQMSRAPDFAGNAGINYFIPNGEGGLRFDANVRYTASYVVTNPAVWGYVLTPAELAAGVAAAQNNTAGVPADKLGVQRFRQKGYALINASVTWTDPSGHYYVQAYGTNLGNQKYRLHYTGNNSFGTYSPMAEPMTFGGKIGYKF